MKHLGDITQINGAAIEPVDCIKKDKEKPYVMRYPQKAKRIRVGYKGDLGGYNEDKGCCIACHKKKGEYHEVECDWEACPICHSQIIWCDCEWDIYTE